MTETMTQAWAEIWRILGLGGFAALCAACSWATVRRMASRATAWGWVDPVTDNPLKIHTRTTPLVGGFGLTSALLLGFASLGIAWGAGPTARIGVWAPTLPTWAAVVLGVTLGLGALGFRDDLRPLSARLRLAAQCLAGAVAFLLGVKLGVFPPPASLVMFAVWSGLGAVGIALCVNAVNMQDGIDANAGTVIFVMSIGFSILAYLQSNGVAVVLSLSLAGGALGFLGHNLPPARVFLGDGGSYQAGALLGCLGLWTLQTGLVLPLPGDALLAGARLEEATAWSPETTLRVTTGCGLMLGVPLLDLFLAVARRLARGQSPFQGDRDHIYDRLRARGLSAQAVVLRMGLSQTAFTSLGLILIRMSPLKA